MNFSKALSAVAASALVLGLAIPASAAGLTNVISSSTTQVTGAYVSNSSSWDRYAGAQITVSETSAQNGELGANLTGLGANNAAGGNLNLYGQKSQNFSAEANITFFTGGDHSDSHVNGQINQTQTSFSTGVQTTFGN
jgi:hypothetical protein